MRTAAAIWTWIGEKFSIRPAAVLGTLMGAVFFAILMGAVFIKQEQTDRNLNRVQEVLCNIKQSDFNRLNPGQKHRIELNCQHLLDQLLRHPTPQQAARLREILKEHP